MMRQNAPSCATACSQAVPNVSHRQATPANKQWRTKLSIAFLLLFCLSVQAGLSEEPTRYIVVVTGSEILTGAFPDGHTHFLTRTLRPLGLQCVGSMTVNDGRDDIQAALEYAAKRADLVIVTGGLGPTDNDLTCEAISEFTGIPAKEHREVLARVARRFRTPVGELRANLRRQTRVPVGGSYLENTNGTAVGLVFETDNGAIVAMPGSPRELQPMVEGQLIPYLSRRFGTRLPGSSVTVRFVGLGQSSIDLRMKQQNMLPEGVALSSQFEGGRVDFTFSLPEENGENRRRLEELKQKILQEFGESVYATDEKTTLEDAVVALLKARDEKLVLAEIASGGSVGASFSTAVDSENVLVGAYAAPDLESMSQLLCLDASSLRRPDDAPREVVEKTSLLPFAAALSNGASRQWAVIVGPQSSDDSGSARSLVAFCSPIGQTTVVPVGVRGRDAASRARVITRIVDELRKRLVKE
jgi:nicotinamide-nucleotide amidase